MNLYKPDVIGQQAGSRGRPREHFFPFAEMEVGEAFDLFTTQEVRVASQAMSALNAYTEKHFKSTRQGSARWTYWRVA